MTAVLCSKVQKILKGSLDSIPSTSPSVRIQIMGGKDCLRCKVELVSKELNHFGGIPLFFRDWAQGTLTGEQTFENKKFVDITQQRFSLLPQGNFPTNNANFH